MLRRGFILVTLLTSFFFAGAQIEVGLMGGLSNYQGDLIDKIYVPEQTNGSIGLTLAYAWKPKIHFRVGFNFARVNGSDFYSPDSSLRARNLNFESAILEGNIVAQYFLLDMEKTRFSPYIFGGIAVYHFNPYSYDTSLTRVFLQPLGTEGQGLPGSSQPLYNRTQLAIPFGGGLQYAVTDRLHVGVELGFRKLFTDYLDDVSQTYPDAAELLNQRGPVAVQFSYRGDELAGGNPAFPQKGVQRGGAQYRDWYYFTSLTVSYRLGDLFGSGNRSSQKRSHTGCPANPL